MGQHPELQEIQAQRQGGSRRCRGPPESPPRGGAPVGGGLLLLDSHTPGSRGQPTLPTGDGGPRPPSRAVVERSCGSTHGRTCALLLVPMPSLLARGVWGWHTARARERRLYACMYIHGCTYIQYTAAWRRAPDADAAVGGVPWRLTAGERGGGVHGSPGAPPAPGLLTKQDEAVSVGTAHNAPPPPPNRLPPRPWPRYPTSCRWGASRGVPDPHCCPPPSQKKKKIAQ